MRKKVFLRNIIFLALLCQTVIASAHPTAEVKGSSSHDFGTHPANHALEFVFEIGNSGDKTLVIKGVNKTCGSCVEVKVEKMQIPPGETSNINVKLVPGSLSGYYTKNFFLETNDPVKKFVMFRFSGNSVQVAEIRPSSLMHLGKIQIGTSCKRDFLAIPTNKDVEFGSPSVESNYPVALSSKIDDRGLGIAFEFTPEEDNGDMKCSIKIPLIKPEHWTPLEIILTADVSSADGKKEELRKNSSKIEPDGNPQTKVLLEYFHQAGCGECEKVDAVIIPRLHENFHNRIRIIKYDVSSEEAFARFAYYRDKLNISGNEAICMVVNGRHAFNGYEKIESSLISQIKESLKRGETHDNSFDTASENEKKKILGRHSERITLGTLIIAGLIDGINPCVFSTLVFFMSVLTVSGMKRGRLLLFGSLYCLTCFLTYLLLGVGVLRFMKLFSGLSYMKEIFNWGFAALLLAFAVASFRDAWIYVKTGETGKILFQMPENLKNKIHEIIRRGSNSGNLAAGAVISGFLVTIIESVCTGQVYLPALAILARSDANSIKWISYLLLYNLMFIIPLIAIFATALAGTSISKMIKWSRRDVIVGKILLGILFITMAMIMILY